MQAVCRRAPRGASTPGAGQDRCCRKAIHFRHAQPTKGRSERNWSQVLEWDRAADGGKGDWQRLGVGSVIEDGCLVRPLSTNALRGAVKVSHEAMEGWLAKGHPVLERELERREAAGKAEGLREAVADLCEALGVALTAEHRQRLAGLGLEGLQALRAHLKAHKTWPDNLA